MAGSQGTEQGWGELLTAPSLRSVSIATELCEYLPGLPWSQLTDLSISGYVVQNFLPILMQCSSLEVLTIFVSVKLPSPSPSTKITMPRITSLSFCASAPTLEFLRLFEFPNLSSLKLKNHPFSRRYSPYAHVLIDLALASNNLRRLEATTSPWDGEPVLEENLVAALASVTVLRQRRRLSPSTISNIASGSAFPNLEHCEFRLSTEDNMQSIVHMILARSQSSLASNFREVVIYCDDNSQEVQIKTLLEGLQLRGMKIITTLWYNHGL